MNWKTNIFIALFQCTIYVLDFQAHKLKDVYNILTVFLSEIDIIDGFDACMNFVRRIILCLFALNIIFLT